jgi:hypothetical protein
MPENQYGHGTRPTYLSRPEQAVFVVAPDCPITAHQELATR